MNLLDKQEALAPMIPITTYDDISNSEFTEDERSDSEEDSDDSEEDSDDSEEDSDDSEEDSDDSEDDSGDSEEGSDDSEGDSDDSEGDSDDSEEDSDTLSEVMSEATDSYDDTPSESDSDEEYEESSSDEGEEVIIYADEVEDMTKSALFTPVLPLPQTDEETTSTTPSSSPPPDSTEPEDPPMFINPFNPYEGPLYIAKYTMSPDEDMEKCERLAFEVIEGFIKLGAIRRAEVRATEKIGPLSDVDYEGDSEEEEEVDELVDGELF
ncbi:hypothetical protein Moror_7557 [Moniliophthora roreri MCA 2997]|uniref:Uncharacterized protein n=2 Tax=Moniliophthora roreri TaxID=221103 RepID=V2WQQ2_MONRO|nr:hypothetical protein Moror_7557 [Moniliophthora roreri MCA 2997]